MADRPRVGDTIYTPLSLPGVKVGDRFWAVVHAGECVGIYRTESEADSAARRFARTEASSTVTVVGGICQDASEADRSGEATFVHDPERQAVGD